jgi:hypothetical protein
MDKLLTADNISKAGIIGLLVLILVTGSTGMWVWGTTYNEMKKDRDEWKTTALNGLKVVRDINPVPIMMKSNTQSDEQLTPEKVREEQNRIHDLAKEFPE